MTPINEIDLENVSAGTVIPYRVKKGDTLEALSKRFKCTIADICNWNNIDNPNLIEVDQKLIFKF